jgi:predicted DNA-binding transcriptional regulator AlpA
MSRIHSLNLGATDPLPERAPDSDEHQVDRKTVTRTKAQAQPTLEPLTYRKSSAATLIGVSERTIERLLAVGKFPKPDAHAGRSPLWTRDSLVRWIAKGGGRM